MTTTTNEPNLMAAKPKLEALIRRMNEETTRKTAVDRALFCLLAGYATRLPELSPNFAQEFLDRLVTGEAMVDLAIWHLLGESEVFAKISAEILAQA